MRVSGVNNNGANKWVGETALQEEIIVRASRSSIPTQHSGPGLSLSQIFTTSSKSTKSSFVYTIYDKKGQLFKFGVSDPAGVRLNQALRNAGAGSTFERSGLYPKYKAHIYEKYLRSLHYNSTGQYRLNGMKVPYPRSFITGARILPPK